MRAHIRMLTVLLILLAIRIRPRGTTTTIMLQLQRHMTRKTTMVHRFEETLIMVIITGQTMGEIDTMMEIMIILRSTGSSIIALQ